MAYVYEINLQLGNSGWSWSVSCDGKTIQDGTNNHAYASQAASEAEAFLRAAQKTASRATAPTSATPA